MKLSNYVVNSFHINLGPLIIRLALLHIGVETNESGSLQLSIWFLLRFKAICFALNNFYLLINSYISRNRFLHITEI